jgi:hypothetical protein
MSGAYNTLVVDSTADLSSISHPQIRLGERKQAACRQQIRSYIETRCIFRPSKGIACASGPVKPMIEILLVPKLPNTITILFPPGIR